MQPGQFKIISLKQIEESDVEKATPPDSVQDLVERIRRQGPSQVVFVRPLEDHPGERYAVVSGHRYLKAARLSRTLVDVPCLVRFLAPTEEELGEQLQELKRADGWELAWALQLGQELFGWTQEELARRSRLSQGIVSERLTMTRVCGLVPKLITAHFDKDLSYRSISSLGRIIATERPKYTAPEEVKVRYLRTIADRMIEERWPARPAARRVDACLEALLKGEPLPETANLEPRLPMKASPPVPRNRPRLRTGRLMEISAKARALLAGLKRLGNERSDASIVENALVRELLTQAKLALLELGRAEPIFVPDFQARVDIASDTLAVIGWEIRLNPTTKRPEFKAPNASWLEI